MSKLLFFRSLPFGENSEMAEKFKEFLKSQKRSKSGDRDTMSRSPEGGRSGGGLRVRYFINNILTSLTTF